ncbi:retrovirus-related pol polyprotein from transposon TNT 1-94 [Tanacetum coccineum]
MSINTKFLNCLQPEWSKYVTMVHHNQTRDTVSYDVLYDSVVQFEPHVLASKANKAAKNHDPLVLLAQSNASSSQSHANSSYLPQLYYVTHPSLVVDYEDEYQEELQGDSQEDKLTTAMMLLARVITQKFSTPTNNRLHTLSNIRNQAVIQDGRVDIQTKNASFGGNGNKNAGRQNMNQAFNARTGNDERNQIVQRVPRTELTPGNPNVQCYNCNEKGHYACDCQKPRVCDAKYFREQMFLAMKDEVRSNLNNEENDFMLDNSYGEETMEELTAAAISEVNASSKVHEQLTKKDFKDQENWYLEDIIDLEEKLSSHDRIVYKMGQSTQTIHMLGKKPNKVYDHFLKAGLCYNNPKRLKKAIAAQPKMYDGEMLHSAKLKFDSPDSEKTLEDAEESRLKMRNKMVQINYGKLNALYETFVPQQEFSVEQIYFSIPSTFNNGSESKEVTSD